MTGTLGWATVGRTMVRLSPRSLPLPTASEPTQTGRPGGAHRATVRAGVASAVALLVVPVLAIGCATEQRRAVEAAIDEATQVTRSQLTSAAFIDLTARLVDAGSSDTVVLGAAYRAELPCATVAHPSNGVVAEDGSEGVDLSRISVVFPAADATADLPGCTLRGIVLEGTVIVRLTDVAGDPRRIELAFDGFTDGVAGLDGTAEASWTQGSDELSVSPSGEWTRADGKVAWVGGNRVEITPAGADSASFDGQRCASENGGDLDCTTEEARAICDAKDTTVDCTSIASSGVQVRWEAPLPDQGRHTVVLPGGTTVMLDYRRLGDAIEVTGTTSGDRFIFMVTGAP